MSQSSKPIAPAKAGRGAAIAGGVFLLAVALIVIFDRDNIYGWIKAVHVIAIISWMVGQLYLPRLFVYHADALEQAEAQSASRIAMLEVMEKRLIKVIMTPAMLVAWLTGFYLIVHQNLTDIWLIIKLIAVILLTVFHFALAGAMKKLASGTNQRSPNQWRLLNEIPTLLMIVVVIMVIVKPF